MRSLYHRVLKHFFREQLLITRGVRTQAEMAEALSMSERSYADLERGKASCSALTLARYLIYCCDDPYRFLEDLRIAFEGLDESIA